MQPLRGKFRRGNAGETTIPGAYFAFSRLALARRDTGANLILGRYTLHPGKPDSGGRLQNNGGNASEDV
jgi:hypothetical protein